MSAPTKHHTAGELLLSLSDIIVPQDRLRTLTDQHRNYIEHELTPSIAMLGLAQPIVVSIESSPIEGLNIHSVPTTSPYKLCMGYSRLSAFKLLEHTHIPANSRSAIGEEEFLMLEMEENVVRNDMPWQDQTLAIARIHKFHDKKSKRQFAKWSQKATGKLLNVSEATVNQALIVSQFLLNKDPEILSAPNFDAAQNILRNRKQKELTAELAKRTITSGNPATIKPTPRISGPLEDLANFSPSSLPISPKVSKADKKEVVEIPISKMLIHGESVNSSGGGWAFEQPEGQFDIIFTDHPYGINMENLDLVTQGEVENEHDVDENLAQMPFFLKGAFRQLKPDGYLIFFMDTSHHEKLKAWGRDAGFQVMPYEYLWCKTSTCKNRAANVWPTKATESVMIMRKGKATMFKTLQKNWFMDSGDAERKKYGHPFAKPFNLCKELLEAFAIPGMSVLDMYAGSGSMVCHCLALGLKTTGIEKKKDHFDKMVLNVKELYGLMLGGKELVFV